MFWSARFQSTSLILAITTFALSEGVFRLPPWFSIHALRSIFSQSPWDFEWEGATGKQPSIVFNSCPKICFQQIALGFRVGRSNWKTFASSI
ncbi:hypothetical protein AMTR_s00068p00032680 [Amborella trichopoda]|uniref:Uncharacterized protein n=1 Tax=Amborella trichopoda TaxID=13333 RepID=U5DDR5_AMBTC|nr:hypothetical protein AMTR_s00068p00032680 [Amborella trichopoda]